MLFSLIFEYPPMRAKYSYNVVSRHSQSICRQTLVSPLLFLQLLSSAPPYLSPSSFIPSGPSGSFPLVLPITSARSPRRSAIHPYDRRCCYLVPFPPKFSPFFCRALPYIYCPPPNMMMLYARASPPWYSILLVEITRCCSESHLRTRVCSGCVRTII